MPAPGLDYLAKAAALIENATAQHETIAAAADLFSRTILAGRMVHVFGSGHSRIMVEEMWPRYGSFPGWHPIVVGANGQRQAMFLENVPGLAGRILRNFNLGEDDAALVISSSGCNIVSIEMAEIFQQQKIPVVAMVSLAHLEASASRREDGKKLCDFADLVLDTGAPVGDAMVRIDGLDTPVSPGSSVGGCALVNAVKAEVAERLVRAGQPPRVLTAPCVIGSERAAEIFEAAYDEHAHRVAGYYKDI